MTNRLEQDSKDQMGDRMKCYEAVEAHRKLDHTLPILIRLDGRGFSSFTRGMNRPFDTKMQTLMQMTAKHLVELTNAKLGYTQSDEISLVLINKSENSESFFGARVQKICSTLAAVSSVYFNSILPEYFPEKVKLLPTFDCRAWNVPTLAEAANTILWRELDCQKNSVSMAARSVFSHKQCHGLDTKQMKEKMLVEAKLDWNLFPTSFTHGTFFKRITKTGCFTPEEVNNLPMLHAARKNPNLVFERSFVHSVEYPSLIKIENLSEVLFNDAKVVLREEQ
jgi:tRNA(His) 5'-end guanylyltransferase